MDKQLWKEWEADWRKMQRIAAGSDWDVTPLKVYPPASKGDIKLMEARIGMHVPKQLREVLVNYSAKVQFGWHVPSHLHTMSRNELPTSSLSYRVIWDMEHIENHALPSFLNWKSMLAKRDLSEAPNSEALWENQFPFAGLINGDVLTIDYSKPEGSHPVRYFSHDLEMIHGLALAKDFETFVTEMSKLGFAGSEWWSLMLFSDGQEDDTFYLKADSEGGKRWLKWLDTDPFKQIENEPPLAILEETAADRALLTAARDNFISGVKAALAAGATIDCVFNSDWQMDNMTWDEEFCTALGYAVRNENFDMLNLLMKSGAKLNTRRLPMNDAVLSGSLKMIEYLIKLGARVNGWKDQRYWPLHLLVTRREEDSFLSLNEYHQKIIETKWPETKPEIEKALSQHVDSKTFLKILDVLLEAGADPDARWDNGITMLMWCTQSETAEVLLKHGADVKKRNAHGDTIFFRAWSAEKINLLVQHGADINARGEVKNPDDLGETPLQTSLLLAYSPKNLELVHAYLQAGADPKKRDAKGESSLSYCLSIETFELMQSHGLDSLDATVAGKTLLHSRFLKSSTPRPTFPKEMAFFEFLLDLGIDINAQDDLGKTMLHYAAEQESYDDWGETYELIIERGADRSIKDSKGKIAFDYMAKSLKKTRTILKL